MKIIITGTTGMVGEGVFHVALGHPAVEEVLIVNRKPLGLTHPKLKELIHADFFDLSSIEEQLKGYDACLFCLGVSSVGMKEDEYVHFTYTLTMHFAHTLLKVSPQAVFSYISGSGTDSTEQGKMMWARVKGKTENDLMALPFKDIYCFRPGYLHPIEGMKHTHKYYKYIGWTYPLLRFALSKYVSTLDELAHAMLAVSTSGYSKKIIEVKDIQLLVKP
jgi:hypothetical protein